MLSFHGPSRATYCDGVCRRDFLRAGTLALGGLTLADLFRLRAQGAVTPKASRKAVIMIFLSGGPAHLDTWDMKPDAPAEMRGEFKPIKTNVSGVEWCELMPMQAKMADRIAVLRGVRTVGNHTGNEFFSGFAWEQGKPDSITNQKRPAVGSVVSRLRGARNGMPAYVSLHDNPSWEHPYYLGPAHRPFRTFQRERGNQGLANLALSPDVSLKRLSDRKTLLRSFDDLRRDLDSTSRFDALDAANAKALDVLTSGKVRDAFDLRKEPARLKARYGTAPAAFDFVPGQEFLLARRLVEAGVPVVSLAVHGWDTHEKNFETLRKQLPVIDRAFSALVEDLDVRGMLGDVTVIMGGEMGRTPKITKDRAGREHWPESGTTILAGGGLKSGQVVGASDAKGEQPKGRAITPQMMIATLYQALGIDPTATIPDNSGRPTYLLDEREPIKELL
jgi:hypothetical protein